MHPLFGPDKRKQVSLGKALSQEEVNSLSLMQEFSDVFAWSHVNMPNISPTMAQHYLSLHKECKPICRKLCRFHPAHQEIVATGFIREIQYLDWLPNVVVMLKKNGKWRVCVDYSNLNDACPKDTFPFPHIDQIVDATVGHQLLSFLDTYSGYN